MNLIPDLPSGPLDIYRSKASFNWKKMKLYLESPETIELSNEAFDFIETEPVFQPSDHDLTLEEERHLTFLRTKKIYESKIFYPDDFILDMIKAQNLNAVLGLYDWSLLTRKGLLKDFAVSGIFGLGTERHMKYISATLNNEMGFAFCLTEISHGTNTKALRTEARYNKETKSFILHTPDFEAAKCWAGCLGKTASHCLVYAQLYTPDDFCHGLHCFIVPVRDPQMMKTYPGVTILDMGPKLGLNGMDNGVVMFNHYSIPRENLLNQTGDVTVEGEYVSPYKDPSKRFGASLGNLSVGRVSIVGFGVVNLRKCLTIAIRYSAVRKQFGPDERTELPVLEYPLQQWRLFPYLAGLYALHTFYFDFLNHYVDFREKMMEGRDQHLLAYFGQEIHALSCVSKPYSGWLARDAIQECREACGGHGYLKASGLGKLRDDNDANCTYEGDNNVLLQQTSNWLLSLWNQRTECDPSTICPMGSATFLVRGDQILRMKWDNRSFGAGLSYDVIIDRCLESYEWLVCWLCKATSEDINRYTSQLDKFSAKNNSQLFRAHSLSLAYCERVMVSWFKNSILKADLSLQPPLKRLCSLFALSRLTKHFAVFTEGGLLTNQGMVVANIQSHIKELLTVLKPDAVALIDAFAPPDFFLQSVLGNADGKVYDHMYQEMVTRKGALTRDSNWSAMSYNVASKL